MSVTIEARLETLIARPPEQVWDFVSDLTRLSEWLEEFRAVVKESEGPVGKGTVFRYTIDPGSRTSTVWLTEWVPGSRLAWDGPPLAWRVGAMRPRGYFRSARRGRGPHVAYQLLRPESQGGMVLLAPLTKRWLRRQRR